MLPKLTKRMLSRMMRGELSKLDELHQRHAGEECYIFGDGISLKWMDLARFSDRPSLLGGLLMYHRDVRMLRVPYCVLSSPFWFWPIFPYHGNGKLQLLRHRIHEEYRRVIRAHPETLFFLNVSNYPVARFDNARYISRWYVPDVSGPNPFRDRLDAHRGTLAFQLSLAIFLGFREAFLVGHDYTHHPSRSLHFYEKGMGVLDGNRGFSAEILRYAKDRIDLTTVTLDAESETLPVISYRDLTGGEPHFRENTDLLDDAKLRSLASWHGYTIY